MAKKRNKKRSSRASDGDMMATAIIATDVKSPDRESSSSLKRSMPHDGTTHDGVTAGETGDDNDGWQTIQNGRPVKKLKKVPKKESGSYPAITHSSTARLQSKIQVSDLRSLITYIFADGTAPQWVAVTHRPAFRKIVTIIVPGLEEAMFKKATDRNLAEVVEDGSLRVWNSREKGSIGKVAGKVAEKVAGKNIANCCFCRDLGSAIRTAVSLYRYHLGPSF